MDFFRKVFLAMIKAEKVMAMRLSREIAVGLQILIENGGSLTPQELVQRQCMSKTQAYEQIAACQYFLKSQRIAYVCPKNKRALYVDESSLRQLEELLDDVSSLKRDFSPKGRRGFLFFELWKQPYLKNHQICSALQISRNTCISDIALLSGELRQAGFDVHIGSTVNGYSLTGGEEALRRALVWMLSYVGSWTYPNASYPLASRLEYGYFGLPYAEISDQAKKLADAAHRMGIRISERTCLLSASVFRMWLVRWRAGRYLTDCDSALSALHGQDNLYWMLHMAGVAEELENILVQRNVAPVLRDKIMAAETEEMIRASLSIASIQEDYPETLSYADKESEQAAEMLIGTLERESGALFPHSATVRRNMQRYLKGAVSRVAFGYRFYRTEETLIRRDYPCLLDMTARALAAVPPLAERLGGEELVALTLQYIGWMSGDAEEEDAVKADRPCVGVVCVSTVGIGGLLRTQIQQYFPEATTRFIALHRMKQERSGVDFFVSTLELEDKLPCLRVSALLTPSDRYRIQKQLDRSQLQAGQKAELLRDIREITKNYVDEKHLPILNTQLEQLFSDKKIQIAKEAGNMLTDLITPQRIQCVKRVSDWRESLRLAARPLVQDKSIQESYVDAMVELVEKTGPYIVLAPGIALPHARPEAGVNRLAMALLRVEEPVWFDREKYANLFFVLASADGKSHMNALIQISHIFSKDTVLESFLQAPDPEALWNLLRRCAA